MTAGSMSVWLVVMMTVERFIIIRFPIKGRLLMTQRYALIVSVAVVTILAIFTSHLIFGVTYVGNESNVSIPINTTVPLLNGLDTTTGNFSVEQSDINKTIIKNKCVFVSAEYKAFQVNTCPVIMLVFLNATPIVLISAGNLTIAVMIYVQQRKVAPTTTRETVTGMNKRDRAATKMLFILSLFFFLSLPPRLIVFLELF